MLELTRFEARQHVKQALGMSAGMFGLVLLVTLLFPSIQTAGADFEAYMESLPDSVLATVGGGGVPITTIEGFLILEVYRLFWMMLVGAYLAYTAATLIAGDRERGHIDVLLMTPIPRRQVVAEKFLSMVPDVVLVSLCTFLGVIVGTVLVDEQIELYWFVALHVLSIPYLLACVAFGLFLSVVISSERRAQLLAFAGIAVMYLLESLTRDTDYDWLGDLMFPRYLDPNAILLDNEVDLVAAAILVGVTIVMLLVTAVIFERIDVTT